MLIKGNKRAEIRNIKIFSVLIGWFQILMGHTNYCCTKLLKYYITWVEIQSN